MVASPSSVDCEFSRPLFDVSEQRVSSCHMKRQASSPEMPMQHLQVTDRTRRLKITVLSLSGISIQTLDCSSQTASQCPTKQFSVSASISFSGSCDPKDMKVASSSICSASGLLSVESKPVIVPDGMSDHLVAVWDESISSNLNRDLGGLSALKNSILIGEQKGAISAIPKSNPHLYVVLREENSDSPAKREATSGSTVMSTHSLETGTEDSSMVKPPLAGTEASNYSENFTEDDSDTFYTHSSQTEIEIVPSQSGYFAGDIRNKNNLHANSSQDILFTILNTPSSDKDKKTTVPEILEIKISLLVNQIPSQSGDDEYEDANFVRSNYSPSADGSEAVAHLVLFPDILDDNQNENNKNGRILQIPVRKSINPISKSVKPTVDNDATWTRFLGDPKVCIDLDESSMLWIKVEPCSKNDEIMFDSKNRNPSFVEEIDCLQKVEPTVSPDDSAIINDIPNTQDSMVGQGDAVSISSDVGTATPKHDSQFVASTKAKQNTASAYMCSPIFGLEGLIKSFNGMMMHCGDDVRAFQIDDASMDSTIGSNGTL